MDGDSLDFVPIPPAVSVHFRYTCGFDASNSRTVSPRDR